MNNELITFADDKLSIIKNSVAKTLTDNEFSFYIEAAKSRGLDPLLGQIHAVKRKDKNGKYVVTLQVGIDGFRLIAHRSGVYAGQDETTFEYGSKFPDKAKVTVYKIVKGIRVSFVATAKWAEYYPGEKMGFMWRKLPETMLEKCAEAKALRKAFSSELSGLYTDEEMEQSEIKDVTPQQTAFLPNKSNKNDSLVQAFMGLSVSKSDILNKCKIADLDDLSGTDVNSLREIYTQIKSGEASKDEYFKIENEVNQDEKG